MASSTQRERERTAGRKEDEREGGGRGREGRREHSNKTLFSMCLPEEEVCVFCSIVHIKKKSPLKNKCRAKDRKGSAAGWMTHPLKRV